MKFWMGGLIWRIYKNLKQSLHPFNTESFYYSSIIRLGYGVVTLSKENEMDHKELMQKLASLESVNDYLATELQDVDRLMRMVGFKYGLETVKATARELISKGQTEITEID